MIKPDYIFNIFKNLRIKEEFIIIHSDIVAFAFENFSIQKLWEMIFYGLGKEKTYLMPSFTFSFNKKKKWDYYLTKSETGYLSEFFRKKISTFRTIHPVHSLSVYGNNSKEVPKHNCKSSFGRGSTWEWICKNKHVCNLSLGLPLNGGATICHYPEELVGVNYREYINLKGKLYLKNGKVVESDYEYYSRVNNKNYIGINDWRKPENDLLKYKIMKSYKFNKNRILINYQNAKKTSDFLIKKIRSNQNYLGNLIKI